MLSKIENAKVSSPISVYARIARALEIPLGELFSEQGTAPISFVRKEERKEYAHTSGYTAQSIAFKKSYKRMEPFILIYPPKGAHPRVNQHDNEELLFVIEGELEFRYGETEYVLTRGDCVYFDANIEHSARALGGKIAQVLAVQV
jgi:mannose-6-phosphate isomerase-like protein (cupin superfamily)